MGHNIKGLPKWAQNHIQELEYKLAAYRRRDSIEKGAESTGVELMGDLEEPNRPLERFSRVRFTIENGWVEVRLSEYGRVLIGSDRAVRMHPRAANSFSVTCEEY